MFFEAVLFPNYRQRGESSLKRRILQKTETAEVNNLCGFYYLDIQRTIMAFCAWRRFSASSKISDACDSKTSAVISSPR